MLANLGIGLEKDLLQILAHHAELQTREVLALDVVASKIPLIQEVIVQAAVLAMSKVTERSEIFRIGTGKDHSRPLYQPQLQLEALIDRLAEMAQLVEETRHHGVKEGPMLARDLRGASSLNDQSSKGHQQLQSRTISGGPR